MADKKITVLVIDDSALMRNIISKLIEKDSDLVVGGTAMNGRFGLNKLSRINPDVIVLDLEMPEMNGIEFLKELQDKGYEIPVVILSSIATKGAKITMEALSFGASDFITKPSGANPDELEQVGNQLVSLLKAYGSDYRKKKGDTVPQFDYISSPQISKSPKKDKKPVSARAFSSQSWEKISPKREPEKPKL